MGNNEEKKVSMENCTCYYFDDIIKFEDFVLDNFLLDEKLYEKFLVYDISYKTLFGANPFHIRFNKINGFIRVSYGTRYLVLFGHGNMMQFSS